jgi:hypothetical protein
MKQFISSLQNENSTLKEKNERKALVPTSTQTDKKVISEDDMNALK